ncbi:MAG: hypothetical protein R3C05_19920 [Pirellulaceae bacterium]
MTEAGGKLFFRANDGTHGSELWVATLSGNAPSVELSTNVTAASEADQTEVTVTATASAVSGDQFVTVEITGDGITAADYTFADAEIRTRREFKS